MTNTLLIALTSSAWPFQEARDLWEKRLKKAVPEKDMFCSKRVMVLQGCRISGPWGGCSDNVGSSGLSVAKS